LAKLVLCKVTEGVALKVRLAIIFAIATLTV